jgi:threonine/homoserine/homoserine lactone efflux protein
MSGFGLFIVASLALIFTPGPDMVYVLTRGMAQGRVAGAISGLGVTTGILVHTLAASLGLAVLLQTSLLAFWTLKIVGGCYLIYVGVQLIRHRTAFAAAGDGAPLRLRACFMQGFLSNVLNPKVALFFVSFLPQFVAADDPHRSARMIGFGLLFAAMGVTFLVVLGVFAGTVGGWLNRRRRVADGVRLTAGGMMMLLGVRLLAPQRN